MTALAQPLPAPFPWFGGKRKVAPLVWERFGEVANFVEPFFGSGAVLLGRPGGAQGIETCNDADGYVCNFWRAVTHDPMTTAQWAAGPVNESDLHARHVWLRERRETLTHRLEGDPDYFDAQVAGWWVWGVCCWIGGGWCGDSSAGPWGVVEDEEGKRQLVHLGAGLGVQRRRVHLSSAGLGVQRKRVHLSSAGLEEDGLFVWFEALANRLRNLLEVGWLEMPYDVPRYNGTAHPVLTLQGEAATGRLLELDNYRASENEGTGHQWPGNE